MVPWTRRTLHALIGVLTVTAMCIPIGERISAGDQESVPVREKMGKLELDLRVAVQKMEDPAGKLLRQINGFYEKGEHSEVINLGKRIEEIDKYGEKYAWTAAVYAQTAHSYAILGGRAEKDGDFKTALVYFKRAASCNRAFADSVAAYRKLTQPGHGREHIDKVQKLYQ